MADNPYWYTPAQAAMVLGVHPRTLARWTSLKPLVTEGGHRRYLRKDVEELVKRRGRR